MQKNETENNFQTMSNKQECTVPTTIGQAKIKPAEKENAPIYMNRTYLKVNKRNWGRKNTNTRQTVPCVSERSCSKTDGGMSGDRKAKYGPKLSIGINNGILGYYTK